MRIIIEEETPGYSATLFRLRMDDKLIGESLTAAQTHLLVGEILSRVALPNGANAAPLGQHRSRGGKKS